MHIHIIHGDAALRLAVRRVLGAAGFAVSDAAQLPSKNSAPTLVIAEPARITAIRRCYPTARILALGGDGLAVPFTPSQLLAAVRLSLARQTGATTGPQPR
jgi:hypothetical protein